MKSILMGGIAAILIAVAAGAVLNSMNETTGANTAADSVRLN